MIKLVAFDLDGTIGDTLPMCILAFKKAVEPYVKRKLTQEEIVQTFGLNEEGMIKRVAGEKWTNALEDFYIHYFDMHIMCPAPFNGIKELVQSLKESDVRVALVTGKGARSCDITLDYFNMQTCFDCVETGAPDKNRKPEAIKKILEEYQLNPDELIYVGDTVSDVFACREAGVECLSAAWANDIPVGDLERVNPGNVICSIGALGSRLKQCNNSR